MIAIHVNTTVLDRWQGTSQTFEIWGAEPSARYVAPAIADIDRRREMINFFISRKLDGVIRALVPTRMIKPSEVMFTKGELYNAILNATNESVAGEVTDLVMPGFLSLGTVVGEVRTSNHIRYGYEDVTVDSIRRDVAAQQVIKAVKSVKLSSVARDNKYAIGAFAEVVSEEYRVVGRALLEIDDLASVVSDIVTGVRANLDPINSVGELTGIVPNEWMNSTVVQEAAKNLVFIRAALELPNKSQLTPVNDGYKLDRWASVILTALRSSERYAWVDKKEVLRSYSLRKVRNNEGNPVAAVLARNAVTQPVSQIVFALKDSVMDNAYTLSATNDRTGEAIQLAYGSCDFGVDSASSLYTRVASHLAESGYVSFSGYTKHDLVDADTPSDVLALMLSDRVYASGSVDANGDIAFRYTYVVATRERPASFLPFLGTEHRGNEIAATDPMAVFLAVDEFEAVERLPVQPQVYGPIAFNSKLVGFDVHTVTFANAKSRLNFDATINGVQVKGALKPSSMFSMRSLNMTSVVKPHFNAGVINAYSRTILESLNLIAKASRASNEDWNGPKPSDALFSILKKQVGRELLACARALSPAFRDEVRRSVVDRAVAASDAATPLSYEEERVMRARLTQQAYVAYCDLIALEFFLFIQGISSNDLASVIGDPEVVHSYLDASGEKK